MKKFNKIFLSLVLVLILAMPMLAGCSLSDLFGKKEEFPITLHSVYHSAESDGIYMVIRFKNENKLEMGSTTDLDQTKYGNFGLGSTELDYIAEQKNGKYICTIFNDNETVGTLTDITSNYFIFNDTKTNAFYSFSKHDTLPIEKDVIYYCTMEHNGTISYMVIRFKDLKNHILEIGSTNNLNNTEYGNFGLGSTEFTYEAKKSYNSWTCELKNNGTTIAQLSNITYEKFTLTQNSETYEMIAYNL